MSYIPYGEGIYQEKYLKEADREFIKGFKFAETQLDNVDCGLLFDSGVASIDKLYQEIFEHVIENIKARFEIDRHEMLVGLIDSYDGPYLDACYEKEETDRT